MIVVNGEVRDQETQFSRDDVEVVTATVDLEELTSCSSSRISPHRNFIPEGNEVRCDRNPPKKRKVRQYAPEEEITLGPACWLTIYGG